MCGLSAIKTCSTGTPWPFKVGPIVYPKTSEWNYHFMFHTIPEDSRSQNLFNFSVPFHQENTKWWNICSVTLLQKRSTGVKSHDLPGQAIDPALSTQHLLWVQKFLHLWKPPDMRFSASDTTETKFTHRDQPA